MNGNRPGDESGPLHPLHPAHMVVLPYIWGPQIPVILTWDSRRQRRTPKYTLEGPIQWKGSINTAVPTATAGPTQHVWGFVSQESHLLTNFRVWFSCRRCLDYFFSPFRMLQPLGQLQEQLRSVSLCGRRCFDPRRLQTTNKHTEREKKAQQRTGGRRAEAPVLNKSTRNQQEHQDLTRTPGINKNTRNQQEHQELTRTSNWFHGAFLTLVIAAACFKSAAK